MVEERKSQLVLSIKSEGAKEAARDVAAIGKEAEALKADFSGATTEVRTLTSALDDYEAKRSNLGAGVEVAGDVAGTTAGLRGALDVFTGGNSGIAGQILEVAEAFGDVGEFAPKAALQVQTLATKFAETASASGGLGASLVTSLTPALGTAGAGISALVAAVLPIALILGGAALAIKAYTDAAQKQADQFNAMIDAQRSLDDRIAEGLSTDAAKEEAASIERRKQLELDRLAKLEEGYNSLAKQTAGVDAFVKAFDSREQALADQIAKSKEAINGYDASIGALNSAINSGKTTAAESAKTTDTAAKAEQVLATARQGTEAATQGAKSAELKAQETQRAAEAAREKALQEAEQRAEKAAAAQNQYSEAVRNASTAYKESVQDIGTNLKNGLIDNITALNRDRITLGNKFNRDEYELTLKANRETRNAIQAHEADITNIRRDAAKSQSEALKSGDFRALFEAREAGAEALKLEQEEIKQSEFQREQAARDAREDMIRSARQQREDRLIQFRNQEADLRTSAQREAQVAINTRQRALAAASEGLNAELKQLSGYWAARLKLEQQGLNQSLKLASSSGSGLTRTGISMTGISMGTLGQVIQK